MSVASVWGSVVCSSDLLPPSVPVSVKRRKCAASGFQRNRPSRALRNQMLMCDLENGFQKASIFVQSLFVVCRDCGVHRFGSSRRDDFQPADKDTDNLFWCGTDCERQYTIDEFARHDVNQATAFFKPGVLPCCHHGVCLVCIESLIDKNRFEFCVE